MASFLSGSRDKLRFVLIKLLHLIVTIVLIFLLPIVFLLYGVILLYRLVIFNVAKHFDPQLGKMVSAISSIFAAHDVYNNSYAINVAFHCVASVDRDHVINRVTQLLSTKASDGSPFFREMTQKIVHKYGYTFWKNIDFQVDAHVRYLNPVDPEEPVTLAEMRKHFETFGTGSFDPERSPWEILIVKNFLNEMNTSVKSAIVFRLHHSMFDGYSVLSLISKIVDNGPLTLAGNAFQKEHLNESKLLRWLLRPLMIIFVGPYEFAGQLLTYDNSKLVQISKREFKNVMRFHECEPLQIDDLKRIKNHFGVKLGTLNTAMVVGAVRKFLERRGLAPAKMNVTFPLPAKYHPDKLRNFFTGWILPVDLRYKEKVELLQDIQRGYDRVSLSYALGLPETSMAVLRILGSLPTFLLPPIDNMPLASTLIHSSFPGPIDYGYVCGAPVAEAIVAGSISRSYPISTLSFSYNGVYKVGFSGDTSVFRTPNDIEELGNDLYQEFLDYSRQAEEEIV